MLTKGGDSVEHKSLVNISSVGASYKSKMFGGEANVATIIGNGYAASTDEYSLRKMSEDLTGCVDRNNERVFRLMKGD